MRLKDNFYFHFSVFTLFFIFVLIYYFYEMDYKLSGFIDVKTVLTVLGTVFGAYFGAKVAGKYAVDSVEKQIEDNNTKELEKSTKTIKIIRSEIYMFRGFLDLIMEYRQDSESNEHQLYILVTEGVKQRAIDLENTLNKVDWMYIPLDEFIALTAVKEIVRNILNNIEYIERTYNLENGLNNSQYLWERSGIWVEYINDLINIESRLEKLI